MPGQEEDVVSPVLKRRDGDLDHVQAIVEVLPEAAFLDQAEEVLVRRGEDPHVDFPGLSGADHADFLLLQHPQELDLHGEAGLADLVQEDRAAVRGLEEARPGTRALP